MHRRGVAGSAPRPRAAGVGFRRVAFALLLGALLTIVVAAPASAADPDKVGDLTGNFSPITYLLIPLALILAFLTAVALGPRGDPGASTHREGGLQRALTGRDASDKRRPS